MPIDKKFAEEALGAHNEYRKRHQASNLKLSSDLNDFAQRWAEHLVATNKFEHSDCNLKGEKLGENVAMKWASGPTNYTGQDCTDQWYSEVKDHTFGCEPSSLKSGHFSQVVWKGSKEMGIGKAEDGKGKTIVVASYRPAGNMMGKFAENVLPPKDGKILLPVDKSKAGGSGPFSDRFDEARGRGSPSDGARGGTETKTTRTYTTTEGSGPNKVTKTVVEETIIGADGSKRTTRKETVTTGSGGGATGGQSKSKSHRKGSSSDSSPETSKKPQKMKDFIDDAVNEHNKLRAKHGAGKLKHAKDLTEHAQKWAEHLASTDSFKHSQCVLGGDKIGENICCKWSSAGADYTGKEACEQWYSEISKHDFGREPTSLGSGHFTQMVWKASKEMGIGKAKTSGGKCIVVANYRPAGNFVGRFVENVAPLKK